MTGSARCGRRRRYVAQRAVDAATHLEFPLERFEMNVAGMITNGLAQHPIHEAHDRRLPGHPFEVGLGRSAAALPRGHRVSAGRLSARGLLAIVEPEQAPDCARDRRPTSRTSRPSAKVRSPAIPVVEGINRQQVDRPRVGTQRHHGIAPREISRAPTRRLPRRPRAADPRRRPGRDVPPPREANRPRPTQPRATTAVPASDRPVGRHSSPNAASVSAGKRLRFAQKRGDGLIVAFEHRGCDCENGGRAPDRAGRRRAADRLERPQLVTHLDRASRA